MNETTLESQVREKKTCPTASRDPQFPRSAAHLALGIHCCAVRGEGVEQRHEVVQGLLVLLHREGEPRHREVAVVVDVRPPPRGPIAITSCLPGFCTMDSTNPSGQSCNHFVLFSCKLHTFSPTYKRRGHKCRNKTTQKKHAHTKLKLETNTTKKYTIDLACSPSRGTAP